MPNKLENKLAEYELDFDSLYAELCLSAYSYVQNIKLSREIVQKIYLQVEESDVILDDKNHAIKYLFQKVKDECLDGVKDGDSKYPVVFSESNFWEVRPYFEVSDEGTVILEDDLIEKAISLLPKEQANDFRKSIESFAYDENIS